MTTFTTRASSPPTSQRPEVAVILFGIPKAFVVECQIASRGRAAACTSVRDLQSACKALAGGPIDVLVVSRTLPPWDREVVAEHAHRAGVPLEWWDPDDPLDADQLVQRWERVRRHSRPPPG
jgi:hypothetical protein